MGVLGAAETASAEDFELAKAKLRAVHAYLKADDLLRWTLSDIPDFAEEPYVYMAAFLAAPEFSKAPDVGYWTVGMKMIQGAVQVRSTGTVGTEYF